MFVSQRWLQSRTLVSVLLLVTANTSTVAPNAQPEGASSSFQTLFAQLNAGGVLDLVPGQTHQAMSLTVNKPLTLRGASNSSWDARPTIVAEDDCVSAIAVCAEKESDVAFDNLQLRHAGGNFDSGSSDNQSTEVGAACCIGVDGGFLQMSSCSVSAVNGTGVGLTGMNSTALLKNCELANSSVGACACQAAKFGCGSSSFSNFSDAAVVLIGNKTLGELEGNTMDRCGILGISVSEGAGLIAEENSIAGCSRAGISVVGKSWARVTSNRIVNNGEHGVVTSSKGTAVVQDCVIREHEHGVTAIDAGSIVWTTGCELEGNDKGALFTGIGGVVERDSVRHIGEGLELPGGVQLAPGPHFDPTRDLAVPVSSNVDGD